MVEQRTCNAQVDGSIPFSGSINNLVKGCSILVKSKAGFPNYFIAR